MSSSYEKKNVNGEILYRTQSAS
jgi:hypothetical protein